jgi:putative transcriptional regulator
MQNQIEKFRKRLKLTQEELASKCNVTRQTIISLEQGNYNPSLELSFKLKQALKAKKIEDLFSF